MTVVADTSFLVDVVQGHEGARKRLEELSGRGEPLIAPTLVAAEFLGGRKKREEALLRLEQAIEFLPFSMDDAEAAGRLGRKMLADGTFPGWVDVFIAGFAASRGGLAVVTANGRHFPHSTILTY